MAPKRFLGTTKSAWRKGNSPSHQKSHPSIHLQQHLLEGSKATKVCGTTSLHCFLRRIWIRSGITWASDVEFSVIVSDYHYQDSSNGRPDFLGPYCSIRIARLGRWATVQETSPVGAMQSVVLYIFDCTSTESASAVRARTILDRSERIFQSKFSTME
jgi:hypothetical protein